MKMPKVRIFSAGKSIEFPNVERIEIDNVLPHGGRAKLNISNHKEMRKLMRTYDYIKKRGC